LLEVDMGQYVSELLDGEHSPPKEIAQPPEGMAYIPAGPFIAGERAETRITTLSSGFFIAKYQVTNCEFEQFVNTDGYECEELWSRVGWELKQERDWRRPRSFSREGFNAPEQPVVGVSFFEAEAYCAWLSQQTGYVFRLPTAPEWEKAARSIDGRKYPWGNQEAFSKASTAEQGLEHPLAVGGFSPEGDSPYGLADMAGNAWDWITVTSRKYAVKGGSFAESLSEARSANSRAMDPRSRSDDVGFRIVQELTDENTPASG
jgi:formylglycine-generating enzyme required for sulfatase activity